MKKIFSFFISIFAICSAFAIDPDISANTIQLHWYNGNTELTVPAESQSCVYDDWLVPPSTIPQREGYDFVGWRVRDIPYGYTKLQYIESNGTQRIDTGIYPTLDTAIDTKFVSTTSTDSMTRIIIADKWFNSLYQFTITPRTRSYSVISSLRIEWANYWKPNIPYTVHMDKNTGVTVNGAIPPWTGTAQTFTSERQLTMFNVTDVNYRGAKV